MKSNKKFLAYQVAVLMGTVAVFPVLAVGVTELVSKNTNEGLPIDTIDPSISADGRYITYVYNYTNVGPTGLQCHREILDFTAAKICKQLSIPLPV